MLEARLAAGQQEVAAAVTARFSGVMDDLEGIVSCCWLGTHACRIAGWYCCRCFQGILGFCVVEVGWPWHSERAIDSAVLLALTCQVTCSRFEASWL